MATDYRKQFQSLNLVFNYNKTESLFLRFTLAFLKLKELRCDIALLSKCLQFSDQGTTIASLKIETAEKFFFSLFLSFPLSFIYFLKLRDGPLEKLWEGRGIFEPQEFFFVIKFRV